MSDRDDLVRVACWNVEHNGHAGHRAGANQDRRHLAMDILRSYRPYIMLRQELTHAALDGAADLYEEAAAIGPLQCFLSPATPESPNPTAVFVDTSMFEVLASYTHVSNGWHPITNPVVRLRGEPGTKPLSLASFHLCSYDPATREREARRLVTIAAGGREVLIGGDCNSYPHRTDEEVVPLPDWSAVTDPNHFHHRTILGPDGAAVSDTRPDKILAGRTPGANPVYVELGHHSATDLLEEDGFAATASLWRSDQGRRSRIDRLYATARVADALVSFEVVANEDVAAVSDHALLVASFDRDLLRDALTPTSVPAAA
ncbi:endonuclease/exonuclease/phosphatase family protein [Streptomyces sp. CBMA29]|uniref:endonuclease/exonuclease/phosphatase family protein n=1 Tax=Streptomyces sp. CBMA29 TaxID=1896314 RepID=UPI001CB6C3A0|nr:endonuclease/exonuclease/phosphatase family protein [Streptomyces sp. CBMA29]